MIKLIAKHLKTRFKTIPATELLNVMGKNIFQAEKLYNQTYRCHYFLVNHTKNLRAKGKTMYPRGFAAVVYTLSDSAKLTGSL